MHVNRQTRSETILSASRPELLDDGPDGVSDDSFRQVIYALFVTGTRFEEVREAFGREIGLTGPQYFVLMAVSSHEPDGGVGVRGLADYLHMAPPQITAEVNKLVKRGLLSKQSHPEDGRRVVITLAEAGREALVQLAPLRQRINDILFDGFSRKEFRQMAGLFDRFVRNTARALQETSHHEQLKALAAE